MLAQQVFNQNDGDVTKAYYARLNSMGPMGQLAVALFRAQKRSTAAKKYRGRGYRQDAYAVKNWSLSEICRIMVLAGHPFPWGWQRDPYTPGFEWVLYVDLPTGQCSFHSADRLQGPDYAGKWDGLKLSKEHILAFCDQVATQENTGIPAEVCGLEPRTWLDYGGIQRTEAPQPSSPWDRMRQQVGK